MRVVLEKIPRDKESYTLKSMLIQAAIVIIFTLIMLFIFFHVLAGPGISMVPLA